MTFLLAHQSSTELWSNQTPARCLTSHMCWPVSIVSMFISLGSIIPFFPGKAVPANRPAFPLSWQRGPVTSQAGLGELLHGFRGCGWTQSHQLPFLFLRTNQICQNRNHSPVSCPTPTRQPCRTKPARRWSTRASQLPSSLVWPRSKSAFKCGDPGTRPACLPL